MSHLDEGTLHALLDGELDLHEVKEIQAHIGSCAACGTRLREVKEFHGESDRLVALLEVPATASRRTATGAPEIETVSRQPANAPPHPPRDLPRLSGPAAEPPPLLLPENSEYGRSRFMRRMRWAALALVTVGAGYMGTQMRKPSAFATDGLPFPALTPIDSGLGAVLSSEEAAPAADTDSDTALPAEAKRDAPPVPRRVAPRPPAAAKAAAADLESPESPATGAAVRTAANFEDSSEDTADQTPPSAQHQADVRSEAARALRELDRERQMDRAASATAALDSARRREALARPSTPAPPAPRTPEQRAQTYLRIGLDEAAKQLGRPVHVIEGMSPLFMGLAQGKVSPGADPSRPVVRVVYQDSQGRLIFLDQQRLRPGQVAGAQGTEPRWTHGEISLRLSGEVGADILRNLRSRVR